MYKKKGNWSVCVLLVRALGKAYLPLQQKQREEKNKLNPWKLE